MTEAVSRPSLREYWPRRYSLVGMCFCAVFICYLDRAVISVTIIPMAKEFGWDRGTQGLVMSSFFVGYMVTQILGGRLADRFGGKTVLGFGVLFWSLFTILTPIAAFMGVAWLYLVRVGMGIGEGVTFPSMYSMFGRWLPVSERSRVIGLNFSAIPIGTVFALLATPWIVINFGWEWSFYLFGGLGVIWWIFWHFLATASPKEHPSVAPHELSLIEADTSTEQAAAPPPWGALLKSTPVWAIIVCHFCNNWAGYVLLSWMPTYISEGLGVNYAAIGLFATIPSLASFLMLNVAGWTTDHLIAGGMPILRVRKIMQAIGFGGYSIILLVVGYVTSPYLAIALMTLGAGLGAFVTGGFLVNHLDIAPKHAGVLMGFSNTAGTIPGIIGVTISGLILQWTDSWALVFQLAAVINLLGLTFYLKFASATREFD
jgi:ACS family sodium-dependent inorganic phosphate cotransporter